MTPGDAPTRRPGGPRGRGGAARRARPARRSGSSCSSSPSARIAGDGQRRASRSPRGSRPSTTTRGVIGRIDGRRCSSRTATGSPTSATTTSPAAFPAGVVREFLRQRDRAQLRRHRRAHGGQAARHRRALQRLGRGDRPRLRPADHRPLLGRPSGQLRRGDDLAQLHVDRHLQRRHDLPAVRARARSSAPASRTSALSARFGGSDLAIQYDDDQAEHGDNSALPADQYTDKFPVPVLFRVGVGIPYRIGQASRLLLAADAFHPNDNAESMSLGGEWTLQGCPEPARRIPEPVPEGCRGRPDARRRPSGEGRRIHIPFRLRLGRLRPAPGARTGSRSCSDL